MKDDKTILVLGATGMLGSAIYNYAALRTEFNIVGSYRTGSNTYGLVENDSAKLVLCDFDPEAFYVKSLIRDLKPAIVVNCIGVIKQRSEASEVLSTVPINSVLPHQLHAECMAIGSKLIHFSTDCVFSGTKGNYTEDDTLDVTDVYGLSKYLGEVVSFGALTLRTSIIGHELTSERSLLNWFLSQTTQVRGFANAYFSGLTTFEVARVCFEIIEYHPNLSGLYHLASEKISKYDLLVRINSAYEKNLTIVPDGRLRIDRSLNGSKLRAAIGYVPQSWDKLIEEMKGFKDECDQYFQR